MSNKIGTECTESQAKEIAKNAVKYKLSELINPSDIKDGAEQWSDIDKFTVEKECHESAEIMLSERQEPYHGIVRDYALVCWRDSLPRVNRDHLTTDNDKEIIVDMGYWPYDMSYFEVYQVMNEYVESIHDIPNSCYNEARETIGIGIVRGMLPNCYQGDN